jgi:predicted transcriptional regulator
MRGTSLPALGPLETRVMEFLWEKGKAPIRVPCSNC